MGEHGTLGDAKMLPSRLVAAGPAWGEAATVREVQPTTEA
jgi:hypothetical protein